MSCHVMSCHAMPCHVMPCHVTSCHCSFLFLPLLLLPSSLGLCIMTQAIDWRQKCLLSTRSLVCIRPLGGLGIWEVVLSALISKQGSLHWLGTTIPLGGLLKSVVQTLSPFLSHSPLLLTPTILPILSLPPHLLPLPPLLPPPPSLPRFLTPLPPPRLLRLPPPDLPTALTLPLSIPGVPFTTVYLVPSPQHFPHSVPCTFFDKNKRRQTKRIPRRKRPHVDPHAPIVLDDDVPLSLLPCAQPKRSHCDAPHDYSLTQPSKRPRA